ncbi:MAG: WS/DGAT domain-containing protein, partial [Gammaproteobacteria bacterium]|nr:WS/DGAT domain-containing protein [Gammaproteobacteria bacterium]
ANTQKSKIYASALPANQITGFLPSETLALAARVYTRTRLGGRHRPFYHVTITNVPGPPIPLYVAGARIHSVFGMAPILDGLGLILVIFSYQARLSIGISSCQQMVPDPACMVDCISRSLDELENAVGQANPVRLAAEYPDEEAEPQDLTDSLQAFRDASKALDKAIESLED